MRLVLRFYGRPDDALGLRYQINVNTRTKNKAFHSKYDYEIPLKISLMRFSKSDANLS